MAVAGRGSIAAPAAAVSPAGKAAERGPTARTSLTWLHGLAAAAALVLAFAFLNPVAVRASDLRAVTETMIVTLALTAAGLLQAQFVRTRRYRDLVLFGSVLTLSVIELVAYFLPAALDLSAGSAFGAVGLAGRLLAAVGFVLAALAPGDRLIGGGRRPVAIMAGISLLAVALAMALSVVLGGQLIFAANHPIPGVSQALKHPLAAFLAVMAGGLLVFAAVALARADRREGGSELGLALLAGAAVLLAAARFYYLPLPWLSADWVSPREGIRVLGYALVLAAVIRHELTIRADIARVAAAAERRRVAQDLHDGIAQDLALIAAHGPLIANTLGGEHPVIIAARRALAVSRGTISSLSDPASATTRDALQAVADELRTRFEIAITVDGRLPSEPDAYVREDLCRIAREAIANAARHGEARNVIVSLRQTTEGITMRISDDGCGIGFRSQAGEGFGLSSMRERAAALGGQFSVRRSGRRGTELEVTVP